jgi:O-antigen biosynthesis protein WbqP
MIAYQPRGKRALDVALSGIVLTLASPVMLACAIAILLEDGRTVIFRQERVGASLQRFVILKFRSMRRDTGDVPSGELTGDPWTRVGHLIRRLNVDELPQLINILRGDMSVVGPRPAIAAQRDLLEARRRNGSVHVKPGLTGLAQIKSYDGMPSEEKARFDGEYARRVTFAKDVLIIARTFLYLLKPPPTY